MSIRLYSLPDTMGRSKHNGFVSPGRVTPKDGTCDFSNFLGEGGGGVGEVGL